VSVLLPRSYIERLEESGKLTLERLNAGEITFSEIPIQPATREDLAGIRDVLHNFLESVGDDKHLYPDAPWAAAARKLAKKPSCWSCS
jgi:hypothetical protein